MKFSTLLCFQMFSHKSVSLASVLFSPYLYKTSHQALSAKRAADLSEVKAQDPTFLLRECSLCLKRGVSHLASLLVQHYLSGYKRGPPSEVCPLEYASLSDVKCII